MFTIRHIKPNGEEVIYAGKQVRFVPAHLQNCAPANDILWFIQPDGMQIGLEAGTVFVMNDSGKTVARYGLDEAPPSAAARAA